MDRSRHSRFRGVLLAAVTPIDKIIMVKNKIVSESKIE